MILRLYFVVGKRNIFYTHDDDEVGFSFIPTNVSANINHRRGTTVRVLAKQYFYAV